MYKAILFDFWGTLVENGVWSPIRQVQKKLEIDLPFSQYVIRLEHAMMTKTFPTLKDAFLAVCQEFKITPEEETLTDLIGLWNKNWMLARPYPETIPTLEELKKTHQLILISNTDCFSVPPVLEKFDLKKLFHSLFLSYELNLIKTDKEFFPIILNKLKLPPEECLLIGDSIESDMLAAQFASIPSILINRRGHRDYPQKIKDLTEIKLHLKTKEETV